MPIVDSVWMAAQAHHAHWASARLAAERSLILDTLMHLRAGFQQIVDASTDSNADDEHDPEGATIAFERSQLKALIQQTERHLTDVDDARTRLAAGRFGLCEGCGQSISDARLDARPAARTCIACARLAARAGARPETWRDDDRGKGLS